ncbi:hypothetical protein CDAR_413021 [Caerostris darwini]|uniref:Uncharacterized protein n=1 Tax=Caerostris darwini TaxID=1538125 RepID=A0AAV4R7W9_9ARAC|nr:hypothetical protein CDAR_413021 [Caerostris darwini]
MHFPAKQQRHPRRLSNPPRRGRMNRFGHPQSQEDLIGMRGGCPRDWRRILVTSSRRYFSSGIPEDQKASCSPKSSYSKASMSRFATETTATTFTPSGRDGGNESFWSSAKPGGTLLECEGVSPGLEENSRHVRPAVFLIRDTGGSASNPHIQKLACHILQRTPTYMQSSYSFPRICIMPKSYTIRL